MEKLMVGKTVIWAVLAAGILSVPAVEAQDAPPLSEAMVARARATPFVVGGVRMELDRFVVALGPVRRGGSVLTGTADHAWTARVSRPMTVRYPVFSERLEAGAILHGTEFVLDGPDGDQVFRTWCGDMGRKTVFGGASPSLCFLDGDPARRAFVSETAKPWLSTSHFVMGASPGRADHFDIEESAEDLIGPMEVRFEIQRVRRNDLTVRMIARKNGQDATVMTAIRAIENGHAMLPLWSHTLSLAVVGDQITPSLIENGDGTGPTGLFRSTQP